MSWAELYARVLFLFLVGNVPLRSRGLLYCPLNNVRIWERKELAASTSTDESSGRFVSLQGFCS